MKEVSRETTQDKLDGLLNVADILFDEMNHNTIMRSFLFGIITSKRFIWFRTLANGLSILTNLLILVTLKRVVSSYDEEGFPITKIELGEWN